MVKLTKRNMKKKGKKSVKRRSKKAGFNDPNVISFSNSPYHPDYHKNREKIPYEFKKKDYKFSRTLSDITGMYSDAGKVKRILKDFNSKHTNEADLSSNWLKSGIPRKYSEQKLEISEDTKNLLEHLKINYPDNSTLDYISKTVKYTDDSTGGRKRKTKKSRKSRKSRRTRRR